MNTPSRISQERIEKSVSVISSEFLNSPQYICESLSAELGARVLVKIETANPIRSFKGRGAELYMSKIPAGTEVVCASAGNFGQAMAYAARRRGIRVSVVAARNANPLKIERMKSLGADVILAGEDFDSARAHARLLSAERSARLVVDSLDIETVEGAGTIGLELSRLHQQLDVLLVALGNGAMFNGIAHVMKNFHQELEWLRWVPKAPARWLTPGERGSSSSMTTFQQLLTELRPGHRYQKHSKTCMDWWMRRYW